MTENDITYTTDEDDVVGRYQDDIRSAPNLSKLKEWLSEWAWIAADAEQLVAGWTDEEFAQWRADIPGLTDETQGQRMNDLYGSLVLPFKMLQVSLTAHRLNAPWGMVYLRTKQALESQ